MLKKRVITGLWGIPLLVAAVWFARPIPWFTVLVTIWGLLAAYEFYKIVGIKAAPIIWFGLIWTALFIISPYCPYGQTLPLLLTSAVVLSLLWLLLSPKKEGAFLGWGWTMAGILYIGWLLSHLVALRGIVLPGTEEAGRNLVFLALFATFGSDTAAYFAGRALGKHKLAPSISPGKTWEGTIAGLLGAVIISLLFTLSWPLGLPIGYGTAVVLGLVISVFGQLGDLVESLLKRNMGVKDSGRLLPGHGGALDRIDSVVFAGVVLYYYVIWLL